MNRASGAQNQSLVSQAAMEEEQVPSFDPALPSATLPTSRRAGSAQAGRAPGPGGWVAECIRAAGESPAAGLRSASTGARALENARAFFCLWEAAERVNPLSSRAQRSSCLLRSRSAGRRERSRRERRVEGRDLLFLPSRLRDERRIWRPRSSVHDTEHEKFESSLSR